MISKQQRNATTSLFSGHSIDERTSTTRHEDYFTTDVTAVTMTCTPYVLFGWLGAVLINVGFITLIAWGTTTYWAIGFVACFIYAVILFFAGLWLEGTSIHLYERVHPEQSRSDVTPLQDVTGDHERTNNVNNSQNSTTGTTIKLPLTVSILYGLSVISVGVCGSFLPINLVPTCTDDPYSGHPRYKWMTNFSNLPEGAVQDWAKSEAVREYGSFAYVADAKVTLFSASSYVDGYQVSSSLWTVNETDSPQNHPDYQDPQHFTVVNDDSVCFLSQGPDTQYSMGVYCSNGTKFRSIVSPQAPLYEEMSYVSDMFAWNNTLWFKQIASSNLASGALIFSVMLDSMKYSLHSIRVESSKSKDDGCARTHFMQSLLALFTVAIPTTIFSLVLWKVKSPPSMAITTFAGLSLIFSFVYGMVDPNATGGEAPWQWWCCVFGAAWLLGSTYLNLTTQVSVAKPPLHWGLVVATISFAYGATSLLPMERNDFLAWVLLNILVIFPILVLGMANSSMFLIFLGSLGFLADAARIAGLVQSQFFSFMVFSVTGLVVGFIGFLLTKNQIIVESFAVSVIRKVDGALFGQSREGTPALSNSVDENAFTP